MTSSTTAVTADFSYENKYLRLTLIISFVSLLLGGLFGLLQALERAPKIDIVSANYYYLSLTAHGVLMAIVFTTFFILGLSTYAVTRTLGTNLASRRLNALAYALAIGGTVVTALVILAGQANVLYTFYPPMKASPFFYLGATVLVVGTWVYSANIFLTVHKWRRAGNKGARMPLATYGVVVTLIIWIMATVGVAAEMLLLLIPWSTGLVDRVDPLMARNLFWYFGHPLVYFWLLPAYVVWYTVLPRVLKTTLFSDSLGRLAFTLFVLYSVPVGFHHQFMDPGIASGWKYLHTVLTFFVFIPSLMTAFTITATMEKSARAAGGSGLLGWIFRLPWKDPAFAAVALSMIAFGFGGAGGAVNAGFNLNAVIHNTAWVPGHLHLTVGTAVALTFMGLSYLVVPQFTGRKPVSKTLALTQIYGWFAGVAVFSTAMHIAGILGSPRRTFDVTTIVPPGTHEWSYYMALAGLGGIIMFASIGLFIVNMALQMRSEKVSPAKELLEPPPRTEPVGTVDNLRLWVPAAIVLILVAYAIPTVNIIRMDSPGAPPVTNLKTGSAGR